MSGDRVPTCHLRSRHLCFMTPLWADFLKPLARHRGSDPLPAKKCELQAESGRGARELTGLLPGFFNINHPGNAKAVRKHAETEGPESLLKRHGHRTTLLQGAEDAFGFDRIAAGDVNRKPLRFVVVAWRCVRGHEHRLADGHAGVENLLAPLGWNVACGRRTFVAKQRFDFSAKKLLVEFEGLLAVSIEIKIRIELHSSLLEKLEISKPTFAPANYAIKAPLAPPRQVPKNGTKHFASREGCAACKAFRPLPSWLRS